MDSDAVSLPDIRRLLSDASSMRDLSRGLVDADSIVVLPCSEKYLHILSVEISRAWAQPVAEEVNSIAADDAEQRTRFVLNEVGRLLDHPDLFPFNEARVRFLAMLTLDSELRFTVTYANLLIELELEDLEYITERDYSRKTYKEDCSGWENFLLNKAPGAPKDHTDRTETVPETSLQLLPPVAMRIVNDIVAEEKDILTFMEENNGQFDGTSTGSVVMADFETKTESTGAIPTFSLPQQTYDATVRPNPFRQISGSVPEGIVPRLDIDSTGIFMHKLETPQAIPNGPMPALHAPDVFPQVAIRTWHPPTTIWDIRYDHA